MSEEQAIETKPTTALPLMEAFYTIQGEGHHTGNAAYFIRLGGCDVGCHWCDVKESWNAADHPLTSVETMLQNASEFPARMVVITGGEPAMYDLSALTAKFQHNGFRTHIETSGAHPLTGNWHWICFSPKKFKAPLPDIYRQANELKVVVYHASDLEWAEEHAAKVNSKCLLMLQPEWGKAEKVMPLILDYVKRHPQWQISLQTHKYMNIP